MSLHLRTERQSALLFLLGCTSVTLGVILHLPMYWMGHTNGFHLAGMSMDVGMIGGMFLIVAGIVVAGLGLLPRGMDKQIALARRVAVHAPDDAPIGRAHWLLMAVLVVALIIDVMKPAALGFIMPGMVSEYAVPKKTAALVPFFALVGTVTGSIAWGVLADIYGRKASIMLSAVVFVGTSICGAMPSLAWNMGMCFLMGAGAGGMLPVTYALLAETMPSAHRGWALVLVGGLGAVGGYFAASGFSAWLVPSLSWRILWLINLPTGLLLIAMGGLIPESAKFLLSRGRVEEAMRVMKRFGTRRYSVPSEEQDEADISNHPLSKTHPATGMLWSRALVGRTVALSVGAIAWGLINFGLLLWLPSALVERGYSIALSSKLLAESALIAVPTVFACAAMYARWSSRWALVTLMVITLAGLVSVLLLDLTHESSPVLPVALLIVGSNGLLAILLPYTSESYPLAVRGRATGWIAACTKGGGVFAQSLSIAALVPSLGTVSVMITLPVAVSLFLICRFGTETRGLDLQALEGQTEDKRP